MENNHVIALDQFPALVWERILDSLDDSKDVENVLKAFPELDGLFHRKKTLWYFDQVFPHVLKRVGEPERSSFVNLCRQTGQRWCKVIDSFIRNHPSRRPYNQDGINRRTVPYREFSYDDWCKYGRFIKLSNISVMQAFRETLTNIPNPENLLNTNEILIIGNAEVNADLFMDSTLAFLQLFGEHILDIVLIFPMFEPKDSQSPKNTLLKILQCLTYLPNVRKLFLEFDINTRVSLQDIYKRKWSYALSRLQNLETLGLGIMCPFNFQRKLMKHFGSEVRKLYTSFSSLDYGCFYLHNLVELVINFTNCSFNGPEIQLKLKRFQLLKKLTIFTDLAFGEHRVKMTTSALYSLLQNTQLEELDLKCCRIKTSCTCFFKLFKLDTFRSVKYIKLTDHMDQELDFLSAFPSLEHLDIDYTDEIIFVDEPFNRSYQKLNACFSVVNIAETVRNYINEPHVPASINIWDKLLSLKLLSVTRRDSIQVQFSRECGNKPLCSFQVKLMEVEDFRDSSDDDVESLSDDDVESHDLSEADNPEVLI